MCCMWAASDRCLEPAVLVPFLLFQLHYFQRSFFFPLLMKGASRMPLAIMAMGIMFNVLNGYMQGAWIFYLAPADMYGTGWLSTPCFIGRSALFFSGWPSTGILTMLSAICGSRETPATICSKRGCTAFGHNQQLQCLPRANAIWHRYREEFESAVDGKKHIFPFLY